MIVVDASTVLEALLQTPRTETVHRRLFRPRETLVAPQLLDIEVVHVLRRYSMSKQLDESRVVEAIADYLAFPIERYAHIPLLDRIWQLRANLTAYDAAYIALAELLDAPLLTADARLARAAPRTATVELIR